MSRRESEVRVTRAWRLVAGAAGVAALLVGACSSELVVPSVTGPVVTAGSSQPSVPALATSAAAVSSPVTAAATVASPATEVAAPTSTWVVFETVPEPVMHRMLRVPQGDGDVKGALFEVDTVASQSSQELEAAGTILDLCRLEDVLVAEHWPYEVPEVGELSAQERHDLARSLLGRDCRGVDKALAEPLLGFWPSRYRVFGTHGLEGTYFRTRENAAAWYEQHRAALQVRYENTLPPEADLYGSFGYPIEYSGRDSPVDEVRVLEGTVSAAGGVLRGLVRNWSRTLWAYGVRVRAGGRDFSWPLSVQPGEAAPFEIDGWDGPSDPSQIDISIVAEMSNDADISRSWWMLPYPQVIEAGGWRHQPPQEVFDELPAGAEQLVSAGARYHLYYDLPDSHPSLHGELAEGLGFELAVFVAFLGDDGTVADVRSPTPFSEGRRLQPPSDGDLPPGAEYVVDSYGERDGRVHYSPFVVRRYPVPELGGREVRVLFEDTSAFGWVMWIGADHGASAS